MAADSSADSPNEPRTETPADTSTDPDLPQSFAGLTVDAPSTSTHPSGTLTISSTDVTFNSPPHPDWTFPLSSLNLHALSSDPDAHVYLQIGEDYDEVRIRGPLETLQKVYETLCVGVAQCPDEAEDEPEEALDTNNQAAMMARLDGLLQVDEGVKEEHDGAENGNA